MEWCKILISKPAKLAEKYIDKTQQNTILHLPFPVLGPAQGLPPGPGGGWLQSRLNCLAHLPLQNPTGCQSLHPPWTMEIVVR